jgi:hypothetical protein
MHPHPGPLPKGEGVRLSAAGGGNIGHAQFCDCPKSDSFSRFLEFWNGAFAERRCKSMRGVTLDFASCARCRFFVPKFGLPLEISRKDAKGAKEYGNGCFNLCLDVLSAVIGDSLFGCDRGSPICSWPL